MSQATLDYRKPGAPGATGKRTRMLVAFAVVALILIAAASVRDGVRSYLQLHFKKLPVQPRQELITLPDRLGPWVQASKDTRLNPDFEHELGTEKYVFRTYLDSRKLPEKYRQQFIDATVEQRVEMLDKVYAVQKPDPAGSVRFALTYYTGSVDTVPHVPERCFVADGWRPVNPRVVSWPVLPRDEPDARQTKIRLMNFEDQIGSRAFRRQQVMYFFQVNGDYEEDPIFGVRKKLQNLLERYGYFAKIEMVTSLEEDAAADPVMQDFLINAMPEIEKILPDWQQVTQGN